MNKKLLTASLLLLLVTLTLVQVNAAQVLTHEIDFFAYLPLVSRRADQPTPTPTPSLPVAFPLYERKHALYFNQIAYPDDRAIARPEALHLLAPITTGQKQAGFSAWAEAERRLPGLADKIDVVSYNPEHWDLTPPSEQENLPATVIDGAALAHSLGLRYMFVPDRRYAEEYLDDVAAYVDIIGLQGQALQGDPTAYESWVTSMIAVARAHNPDVQIMTQVSTARGSADEMYTALQTVVEDVDGVVIWYNPDSFPVLQEFVNMIRSG